MKRLVPSWSSVVSAYPLKWYNLILTKRCFKILNNNCIYLRCCIDLYALVYLFVVFFFLQHQITYLVCVITSSENINYIKSDEYIFFGYCIIVHFNHSYEKYTFHDVWFNVNHDSFRDTLENTKIKNVFYWVVFIIIKRAIIFNQFLNIIPFKYWP